MKHLLFYPRYCFLAFGVLFGDLSLRAVSLTVEGDLNVQGSLSTTSNVVFAGGLTVSDDNAGTGGLTLGSGTAVDGANLRLLSSSGKPQWNLDNNTGNLRFFTETSPNVAPSVKATLSSVGNLGIGTVSPSEKLDVVGNAKISGAVTVSGTSKLTGDVTVKAKLRVPPSGDIPMGTFTGGVNPSL
jgi:cytoskeletal protein CcmA (bactofilin family)